MCERGGSVSGGGREVMVVGAGDDFFDSPGQDSGGWRVEGEWEVCV